MDGERVKWMDKGLNGCIERLMDGERVNWIEKGLNGWRKASMKE